MGVELAHCCASMLGVACGFRMIALLFDGGRLEIAETDPACAIAIEQQAILTPDLPPRVSPTWRSRCGVDCGAALAPGNGLAAIFLGRTLVGRNANRIGQNG